MQFKTNIKCGACVAKVTPLLNAVAGEKNWKVDLTSKDRILEVTSANEAAVIKAVQDAGFKAEKS